MKVATLGPKGTCSEEVAIAYLRDLDLSPERSLELCESFEDAAALVLSGSADALIMPAAYARYHEITFENIGRLRAREVLFSQTPAFVLAGRDRLFTPDAGHGKYRVACHRSPSPLLRRLGFEHDHVEVASNAVAAHMACDGEVDLCITNRRAVEAVNEHASAERRLAVIRHFGKVDMTWTVFERGSGGERPYRHGSVREAAVLTPVSVASWLDAEGLAAVDDPGAFVRVSLEDPAAPKGARRPLALLVDDDPDVFRLVPEAFPTWEWRYVATMSEALAAVRTEEVAAALVDIGLVKDDARDRSGAALLVELRRLRPELPVLMITGYDREAAVATSCFRAGAMDYMRKPLDAARLSAWLSLLGARFRTHARGVGCELRRAADRSQGGEAP